MAHAAESQHWYGADGKPAYTVIGTNGLIRPTTLRDARKLNLYPGYSTIANCAAKHGLNRWLQEQVLLSSMTLPRIIGESEKKWMARVMLDSQEQGKKAAERGTAIHAAVQSGIEGEQYPDEFIPHVKAVAAAIEAKFGRWDWTCEKSFVHPDGYGGKADLFTTDLILDIKSKEEVSDDGKGLSWPEMAMQGAAYREGLRMPGAKFANVFVSRDAPVKVYINVWTEAELQKGWRMFSALLAYWQAANGYRPT